MKIVIIGDGKVGYKLAKQLSSEKYDIILIDNNEEKLRKSIERMDVFCVVGEGGSVEDRKSTRLNSSHRSLSRMPSSA